MLFSFFKYKLTCTGLSSSVGRVFAPGNIRSLGSIPCRDIPKLLKMVLAAPRLALIYGVELGLVDPVCQDYQNNVTGCGIMSSVARYFSEAAL